MRIERKWVVPTNNYNKLIKNITSYNIGFKKSFEDRYVNSIYFDFPILESAKENFYGLANKRKFRVRWYGSKYFINNPILEIKKKNGWINKKILINLNQIDQLKIDEKEDISDIEKKINNRLKLKKKIIPIVTTHYLRKYFVSKTIISPLPKYYLHHFSPISTISPNINLILSYIPIIQKT